MVQMCMIMKCRRKKYDLVGIHSVIESIGYLRIKEVKIKIIPIKRVFKKKKRIWKWFKRVYFLESFAELFNRVKKEKPLKNEGI